ncbi:biotin transporter BioY [Georgenia sp. 10Sc9-8]|uniref:Biotin transporter n=1 Tax=Georgenia halotolerans TaxID=3028317 RepID=A0ABT5U1S0_9MICO|nr:biotin transporter BioY [Georgenia halotolerans]
MSHALTASAPLGPRAVLADALPRARAMDAGLVGAGAALVAVLGQVALPLPFTPVPLTLGTFAVLLVGATLGPLRAALSMTVFLLAGVLGAPVFAGATAGWAFASLGYAVGYLPAAVLLGAIARRGGDRSAGRTVLAACAATGLVYVVGVPWLMAYTGLGLGEALVLGVAPFLLGDAVKATAAALLLPGTWRVLARLQD